MFEIVAGELHAKLGVGSGMWEVTARCESCGREGLAAAPVGGGGAWPGFEIDHSEPQARVWRSRGRAAAHGHNQQPGPTAGASGARNTSGATQQHHANGWGAFRHPTRQHQ